MSVGIKTKRELSRELGLAEREVDYYRHASRILGFVEPPFSNPKVTRRGKRFLKEITTAGRERLLAEAITSSQIFSQLSHSLRPEEFTRDAIVLFLRRNSSLTGSTLSRRADSLLSWAKAVLPHDPESIGQRTVAASKLARVRYRKYKAGGEGELHKKLKKRVAEDPLRYLGEDLHLIQMEYPFPTNDRADIVFEDSNGGLVAVEIKVDVGPHDVPGLLQAAKYKTMLAILMDIPEDSVRGVLVAREIDPSMRERAERYDIEIVEVPKFR